VGEEETENEEMEKIKFIGTKDKERIELKMKK
jgi:hypothetical protein